jgi:hypothetical protein
VESLVLKGDWYSNKCALIWKTKVTPSNRLLFQLAPSTRPIAATEFGLSRIVRTKKGEEIQVGEQDYETINKIGWHIQNGYARGCVERKKISMHKFVMGEPPKGMEIDHINRNKLDNRRMNLRFVSKSENAHNREMGAGCVWYENRIKRWRAEMRDNGRKQHLGVFLTEQEARTAYETAKRLRVREIGSGLLPTARTSMKNGASQKEVDAGNPKRRLETEIAMIPTPTTRDWKGARKPETLAKAGRLPSNDLESTLIGTQTGLKLQPNFVEWMINFPQGWTDLAEHSTESND